MANEKIETPAGESPATLHQAAAQAIVEQLRRMRETIPHFAVPTRKGSRQNLVMTASLPPEFIELTAVARTHSAALVRGETLTPAETRDLMAYGDAFRPVADELEAMAQFVRFSIDAAKDKAATEALTTYSLARRLARSEAHADLAPHVADMRRALGNRGKRPTAATLARRRKQQAEAALAPSSETK